MNKHSNLFWEIEMSFGSSDDTAYCNRTCVDVRRYDYDDAFNEAQRMYEVQAQTLNNKLCRFDVYLRFDDDPGLGNEAFTIVKHWVLDDGLKSADKFFGNPGHSFEALYLQ